MEDVLNRLEAWRMERGLDKSQGFEFDLTAQVSFVLEEVVEYLRATNDNERVDALSDVTIFCINGLSLDDAQSEACKRDYLNKQNIYLVIEEMSRPLDNNWRKSFMNCSDVAKDMLLDMGYDFVKCMNETLKEIESRKGAFNPDSGKWEKFTDDESMKLWYKADYSTCKIV